MTAPEPFRVAFILAALTAIRAIGPGVGDVATHADELVFGFFSLQLFGFLTIALPRWVAQPLAPRAALWLVLGAQVAAFIWGFRDLAAAAEVRTLAGLFGVVLLFANTPPGKSGATYPVLLLAALHLLIRVVGGRAGWEGTTMAGLAVIVLICLEVSNRVGAAIIAVAREHGGWRKLPPASPWPHRIERIASALALALWGLGVNAGWPAAVAAVAGLCWLAQIRVWQIRPYAGVVIIVVGMLWKRLGFLLLAVDGLGLADLSPYLVIHAFAVGGLATLAIAIATSMTRKRDGRSLAPSPLADVTYAAIALAAFARAGAALAPSRHDLLIEAARGLWAIAFAGYALFVAWRAFAPPTVRQNANGADATARRTGN